MRAVKISEKEYSTIKFIDEAFPTSRCLSCDVEHAWADAEFSQSGTIDGREIMVFWLFDADETEEAGDDDGQLPWDFDHVAYTEWSDYVK